MLEFLKSLDTPRVNFYLEVSLNRKSHISIYVHNKFGTLDNSYVASSFKNLQDHSLEDIMKDLSKDFYERELDYKLKDHIKK